MFKPNKISPIKNEDQAITVFNESVPTAREKSIMKKINDNREVKFDKKIRLHVIPKKIMPTPGVTSVPLAI